jgi:hypothetical protein
MAISLSESEKNGLLQGDRYFKKTQYQIFRPGPGGRNTGTGMGTAGTGEKEAVVV